MEGKPSIVLNKQYFQYIHSIFAYCRFSCTHKQPTMIVREGRVHDATTMWCLACCSLSAVPERITLLDFVQERFLPPYHTLSASAHPFRLLLLFVLKCWGIMHIMNVPILPTFNNLFVFSQWFVWLVDLTPCISLTRLIPFVKSTLNFNCPNKSLFLSLFYINRFILYLFYMLSPVNISNLNSKCYFVHDGWQFSFRVQDWSVQRLLG